MSPWNAYLEDIIFSFCKQKELAEKAFRQRRASWSWRFSLIGAGFGRLRAMQGEVEDPATGASRPSRRPHDSIRRVCLGKGPSHDRGRMAGLHRS
jgi:hypothetical protein